MFGTSDFCNLSGNSFKVLGSNSIGPQNEKLLDPSYVTQTEEGNRLISKSCDLTHEDSLATDLTIETQQLCYFSNLKETAVKFLKSIANLEVVMKKKNSNQISSSSRGEDGKRSGCEGKGKDTDNMTTV